MNSKSIIDFHEKWAKIVDKGCANYSSLTPNERIWFNIQSLIGSVDNGGLVSHYYNSDAEYNKETIEDLMILGFPDIAFLLQRINQLFPNETPPLNMGERNDIISTWGEEQYNLLEELDENFYKRESELEIALVIHIKETIVEQ